MMNTNTMNKVIGSFHAFDRADYYKEELLNECLKFQREFVEYVYGAEADRTMRLSDVTKLLGYFNRDMDYLATPELEQFRDDIKQVTDLIKGEIDNKRSRYMTFKYLEKLKEDAIVLKELELRVDNIHVTIDGLVITPKAIFLLEIKRSMEGLCDDIRVKEQVLRDLLTNKGLKEIRIHPLVILTNSRNKMPQGQNDCKVLSLGELLREIETTEGDSIYPEFVMETIRNAAENARTHEKYPICFDVKRIIADFAELIIALHMVEEAA